MLKAVLPDLASLAPNYITFCIGNLIKGVKNGKPKEIFVYNTCDHAACYREVESCHFPTYARGACRWRPRSSSPRENGTQDHGQRVEELGPRSPDCAAGQNGPSGTKIEDRTPVAPAASRVRKSPRRGGDEAVNPLAAQAFHERPPLGPSPHQERLGRTRRQPAHKPGKSSWSAWEDKCDTITWAKTSWLKPNIHLLRPFHKSPPRVPGLDIRRGDGRDLSRPTRWRRWCRMRPPSHASPP